MLAGSPPPASVQSTGVYAGCAREVSAGCMRCWNRSAADQHAAEVDSSYFHKHNSAKSSYMAHEIWMTMKYKYAKCLRVKVCPPEFDMMQCRVIQLRSTY